MALTRFGEYVLVADYPDEGAALAHLLERASLRRLAEGAGAAYGLRTWREGGRLYCEQSLDLKGRGPAGAEAPGRLGG